MLHQLEKRFLQTVIFQTGIEVMPWETKADVIHYQLNKLPQVMHFQRSRLYHFSIQQWTSK